MDAGSQDEIARFLQGKVDEASGTAAGNKQWSIVSGNGAPVSGGNYETATWNNIAPRESGGRQFDASGNTIKSSAGAIGYSQLEPDTAKAVAAKHGLPWDPEKLNKDRDYNIMIGRALWSDLNQTFNGDVMLAAAAYNAGEKRVGEWIQKFGDPRNGSISDKDFASKIPITETRDYVSAVVPKQYFGQGPSKGGEGSAAVAASISPAQLGSAHEAIDKDNTLNDRQKEIAHTQLDRQYRFQNQANEDEKSQQEFDIRNGIHALEDGNNYDWDEGKIHALFPGAKGNQLVQELNDARANGQAAVRVNGMTNDEITTERARLQSGLTENNASDYTMKARGYASFERAVAQRNAALNTDPADFVARNSPVVQRALSDIDPQHPDPVKAQNADRAVLAEQERLGVPAENRHVLTKAGAQALSKQMLNADPSKTDIGAEIQTLAATHGQNFNRIWGDLVTLGKLPQDWQVIGMISDPVERTNYQRALQFAATKGGAKEIENELPAGTAGQVRNEVQDALAPFAKSARVDGAAQNDRMIGMVRDGVTLLATRNVLNGMSVGAAVERAKDAILSRYDFVPNGLDSSVVMRVPAGYGDAIRDYAARTQATVAATDMAPMPGDTERTTDAQRRQHMADAAHSGVWMTNEGDDGMVLMGRLLGGGYQPIRRADGSRVEMKFRDAMRSPPAQPDMPPGRLN